MAVPFTQVGKTREEKERKNRIRGGDQNQEFYFGYLEFITCPLDMQVEMPRGSW